LAKSAWHFEQAGVNVPDDKHSEAAVALIQERCITLKDVVEQTKFFFSDVDSYQEAAFKKWIKPGSVELLASLYLNLDALSDWSAEHVQACVQAVVDENEVGFAKVAQPIRIAVTGGTMSPSIDQTLQLLGKDVTLARLSRANTEFESVLSNRV
jgi:glutamyl-tRNA synthetase